MCWEHGEDEECMKILLEYLKGGKHLEDQMWGCVCIKTDFKGMWYESEDWIHVAQERVKFWAVANMKMNRRYSEKVKNFLPLWATL